MGEIRDAAVLPGWLVTTTRRECKRVLNPAQAPHAARHALDAENIPDERAKTLEHRLLAAERRAALREAFAHLPPCCQTIHRPADRRSDRTVRRDQYQARQSRAAALDRTAAGAWTSCAITRMSPR